MCVFFECAALFPRESPRRTGRGRGGEKALFWKAPAESLARAIFRPPARRRATTQLLVVFGRSQTGGLRALGKWSEGPSLQNKRFKAPNYETKSNGSQKVVTEGPRLIEWPMCNFWMRVRSFWAGECVCAPVSPGEPPGDQKRTAKCENIAFEGAVFRPPARRLASTQLLAVFGGPRPARWSEGPLATKPMEMAPGKWFEGPLVTKRNEMPPGGMVVRGP